MVSTPSPTPSTSPTDNRPGEAWSEARPAFELRKALAEAERLKHQLRKMRSQLRRSTADLNRARAAAETGTVFRHNKTGLLHRVTHDDALMLGTREPMVVYRSIHGGKAWVVAQSEFVAGWTKEPGE
jgi:hypothetical protein